MQVDPHQAEFGQNDEIQDEIAEENQFQLLSQNPVEIEESDIPVDNSNVIIDDAEETNQEKINNYHETVEETTDESLLDSSILNVSNNKTNRYFFTIQEIIHFHIFFHFSWKMKFKRFPMMLKFKRNLNKIM